MCGGWRVQSKGRLGGPGADGVNKVLLLWDYKLNAHHTSHITKLEHHTSHSPHIPHHTQSTQSHISTSHYHTPVHHTFTSHAPPTQHTNQLIMHAAHCHTSVHHTFTCHTVTHQYNTHQCITLHTQVTPQVTLQVTHPGHIYGSGSAPPQPPRFHIQHLPHLCQGVWLIQACLTLHYGEGRLQSIQLRIGTGRTYSQAVHIRACVHTRVYM